MKSCVGHGFSHHIYQKQPEAEEWKETLLGDLNLIHVRDLNLLLASCRTRHSSGCRSAGAQALESWRQ